MNKVFLRLATCLILAVGGVMAVGAQQSDSAAPGTVAWQIGGTLVDEVTGAPLTNARMVLAPVARRDDVVTTVTSEDGRFQFANLAPGKYALRAQARGHLTQFFNQHDQYSSSIAVGPDLDSSNLLFRLPPEGAISGVVTDEAGEPVRGAQVTLCSTGLAAGVNATRLQRGTTTDEEGAYHFAHLYPGRYLVAVSARPWYAQHEYHSGLEAGDGSLGTSGPAGGSSLDVAYPITFYGGATDPTKAAAVILGAGERITADIALQPVPALHMRFKREAGDRDPGFLMLEKRVLDGPSIMLATPRISGSEGYEIYGIPPGHYSLKSSGSGKSGSQEGTVSREIDVHESGVIDQGQDSYPVAVSANLHFDSGAQRQGSLQLLNKKTGEITSQAIGDATDLVFKQQVVPGSYEISLFGRDVYLKSVVATGAKVQGRTLELLPGTTVKLDIIAARGQGTVRGTALREGKPFAGAMIVLVPADPARNRVLFRRDQSDSDGTFTLPSVVPGAYTALAIENGWDLEWTNPKVLKRYLSSGVAVQVQPNDRHDLKLAVQ